MKSPLTILEALKNVLLEEKEVLINQEGSKIQDIVTRKTELLTEMEAIDLDNIEEDRQAIHDLAVEVKNLQETNAMLTEQSMNYINVFLDALQKEAQKNATYSKEGNMNKKDSSGLLDKSL